MIKSIEELNKELDAKIPREAVSTRTGGGTKALSYLETWYVIDRMNRTFGNLGWDSETVEMTPVSDNPVAYRAKVRIRATVRVAEGQYLSVTREGTGWGSDKNKQNPHEMAVKEAESDALKRAAMKFGMSLGLALYDKSQENVEDDSPAQAPAKQAPQKAADPEAVLKKISLASKVILDKKIKTLSELKELMKSAYGVENKEQLTAEQAAKLYAQLEALLQ